jgi:hypothetical protein
MNLQTVSLPFYAALMFFSLTVLITAIFFFFVFQVGEDAGIDFCISHPAECRLIQAQGAN